MRIDARMSSSFRSVSTGDDGSMDDASMLDLDEAGTRAPAEKRKESY